MSDDFELTQVEHDPFTGRPLLAVAPLTESQREIWLSTQLDDDATLAYDEASEISFHGPLDVARLRRVWQRIVERHEALRCSFSHDGQWLLVHPPLTLDIPLEDLRALDAAAREARLAQLRREEVLRRFDMEQGPLLSVRVVQIADEEHRVFFTSHHIVVDGWSAAEIYKDFARLYDAEAAGLPADDTPAPSFTSFAREEAGWRESSEGRDTLAWWAERFADGVPSFELPTDRPRSSDRSFAAGRVDHTLDAELVASLRRLGASRGASLVATTLGAFTALLHRLTGAEDLVVGLAASAQSYLGKSGLVGHAVNLLPLRFKPGANRPFGEFLGEVRSTVLDAFDHQRFTFSSLLPQLKVARDPGRPPLVPVVFNIDVRNDPISPQGMEVRYRTLEREYENFELFVNAVDDGQTLCFECAFNTALYDARTVNLWMQRFERLLRALVANADTPLGQLPAITEAERERVTAGFNQTAAPYPNFSLPQLVARAAANNALRVAVHTPLRSLDYAELESLSDRIAGALAARGAGPGQFIGLCLQRTAVLPAALLGILKTGAAYLPLDPEFPAQRLRDILEDANARLLIADRPTLPRLEGVQPEPLLLDDLLAAAPAAAPQLGIAPNDPAYVIYTSGTTGKPKGVVVTHGNFANFIASMARTPGLTAQDVVLAVTTISFDIAGLELWLPLTQGAGMVIADRDTALDGEALRNTLDTPLPDGRPITLLQATPGTWRLLLSAGWAGSDGLQALCGGEPLPRDLAETLIPRVKALWNMYGPTETTVWSTLSQVTDAADIDIGKAIANTQCYVLDAQRQPLPVGGVGELWIGGDGVALGYHARTELTAERFVDHSEFGRLYRTGDLARWREDGRLLCLGRTDFQVKLRGFRIELGDIESALNTHADVAESLCAVRERSPGDPRLVAYVATAAGAGFNAGELRRHLRQTLPAYMIPQHYVPLDALPRLPNGKLDRRALPDPFHTAEERATKAPPQTPAERYLAALWGEVLGQTDIGRDDRFLDLGGHSLLAVQVNARMQQLGGPRLPMRAVMMDSLATLAAKLPAEKFAEAEPVAATFAAPAKPPTAAPATSPTAAAPVASVKVKKGLLSRLFGG